MSFICIYSDAKIETNWILEKESLCFWDTKGDVLFYLQTHIHYFHIQKYYFPWKHFPYNNPSSNIVENFSTDVDDVDYACFDYSFLNSNIPSLSPNKNILAVSSSTTDTNSTSCHLEELTHEEHTVLRKSHCVSKPPAYLLYFHCYNMAINTSYPLSNFLSNNNISYAHLSYIFSITFSQEPHTYKQAAQISH